MNPQLLFILAALFFATNIKNTQAQTLNQGLIAHYCLDGNAQDAAGNKHGILMNGAIATTDRGNNPNGAIKLDGINDFIQLPSDPWITGDFTFSGWININSIGSWPHLWGFGNGTNAENIFLGLGQGTNNMPHFTTHGCQNGASLYRVSAQTTSPLNTWFHIVVTLVGSDVKIYKDNQLWVSGTTTITPCAAVKDSSFIGKSNFTFNNNAYVDAAIDDFRFYNRLLSTSEISELYEGEITTCQLSWPNSISQIENTTKTLRIYPNPTTGNFNIETNSNNALERLAIYDQIGRKIDFVRSNNEIILPSSISSGIYYVRGQLINGRMFTSSLNVK